MKSDIRFVAIGDSFTEGVGDPQPGGSLRGWADLVALGWATARGEAVCYANLAIRGRLIWQIVEEQLEPALALKLTHLSFVGGVNDMLRPGSNVEHVADAFSRVLQRCDEDGVKLIVHTGANPSSRLPMGRFIQRRCTQLAEAVATRVADCPEVFRALHWSDKELASASYWAEDRLHMNAWGHHRVAARVLDVLGVTAPDEWWTVPKRAEVPVLSEAAYYRNHVFPWFHRRLMGRSSGDGRVAKIDTWVSVKPAS